MKPLLIGLTGGIGAGKSTVAGYLAELGAEIVVGDELGRRAFEKAPELLESVREKFGDTVFHTDGTLNRRLLGKKVFGSREDTRWLTELTFPVIYELWRQAVKAAKAEVVVFDAAMIFEWRIEKEFDLLILVTADVDTVCSRVAKQNRLTLEEVKARHQQQMDVEWKRKHCHIVLVNNGSLNELESQVHKFWNNRIIDETAKRRIAGNG